MIDYVKKRKEQTRELIPFVLILREIRKEGRSTPLLLPPQVTRYLLPGSKKQTNQLFIFSCSFHSSNPQNPQILVLISLTTALSHAASIALNPHQTIVIRFSWFFSITQPCRAPMSPNRMSRYSIDEMMVLKDNASIDIGRFTISALESESKHEIAKRETKLRVQTIFYAGTKPIPLQTKS